MPSGVYFTFFGSFVFGTPQFPVSEIPCREWLIRQRRGFSKSKPSKVFDNIRDAHETMESNHANGKMVVVI